MACLLVCGSAFESTELRLSYRMIEDQNKLVLYSTDVLVFSLKEIMV